MGLVVPSNKFRTYNKYYKIDIVAIDISFGKRILIIKVKTKAIIKIISRYFDFNA